MSWQDDAACIGTPVDMFFPSSGQRYEQARRICDGCPVNTECLGAAFTEETRLERGVRREGMRGGYTPDERDYIAGTGSRRARHLGREVLTRIGRLDTANQLRHQRTATAEAGVA